MIERSALSRWNDGNRWDWHMPVIVILVATLTVVAVANWHPAVGRSDASRAHPESAAMLGGTEAAPASGTHTPALAQGEERRHRVIAEFLSRKYKVSPEVIYDLVGIAHAVGRQIGLDPLLIIAVISVESRFNPIAESVSGAKGLMQIIPKLHPEKFRAQGGESTVFDPETNIRVGTKILKEYLTRTGNLSMALQMYAGALADDQDVYTQRVLGEKDRLQQILGRVATRSNPEGQIKAAQRKPVPRSAPGVEL